MKRCSALKQVRVVLPEEESNKEDYDDDKENRPLQLPKEEFSPFSNDEQEKMEERSSVTQSEDDIQQVVEETKRREDRLRQQLTFLKEQALAAIANSPENNKKYLESCQFKNRLDKYQLELSSVKETMENILHFTKQTHNEVQRTKDMVSSINELTPNRCGSLRENFDEDYNESPEYSAIEGPIRTLLSTQ